MQKGVFDMNEVIQCLTGRQSVKQYRPEQIRPEELDAIVTAGTYAPSGMGRQPCRIVVLQKKEDIAELEKLNAAILGNPDAHPFYGAPTVLVVLADAKAGTAVEDGSLVLGNLMNAAHALGVGSCWIHRAREEFASGEGKALLKRWGIEGDWVGVGHCILGYAAEPAAPAKPRKADYIVRV